MKHFLILIIFISIITGCATSHKAPSDPNSANIKFILDEPVKNWVTVSLFKGLECSPLPRGEYVGDLHNGSFIQASSEKLDAYIPSGQIVSFELFERTILTSEMVHPGQFCKNLFAFTPIAGRKYLVNYKNCNYKITDLSTKNPIKVKKPTGKCHSKNSFGAY